MSKKGTKALASAALMSLVLTTALSAGPVKAAKGEVTRTSGADRYATAAQVAKSNWTTTDNVVLVSGEGYADSVSASALAKKLDAPILLTTPDTLSSDAESAIEQLKPKNIYVIGGNASISQSIRSNLKTDYNLVELGGANRYETNVKVAEKLVELGVSASDVLVVGGEGFSDALSVAPVAAAKGQILLLANNNESSIQSVIDFVKDNSSKVTVVGTKNVINDAIYNALGASTRVDGGSDRFATNLNVLKEFKDSLKNDKLYVANASPATPDNLYADALVASALAGKYTAPLVLVDKDESDATDNAIDYIKDNATTSTDLNVIGGTGVVSDSIVDKINKAVNPTPGGSDAEVTSINSVGLRQIKVVFNQEVDQDTAEDVNNYTVDGSDLTEEDSNDADKAYDNAVLQDDNKTVLITLKDKKKQNDTVDIKVKKGILSEDKSGTVPEFTESVTFSDTTAPTLESVEARGNRKISVEFSEPVNVGTNPNASGAYSKFKINDKNISGFGLDSTYTKAKDAIRDEDGYYWTNKIDFYFTSALDTGNNTLKVSDGDESALEDAASFPVAETTQDFNVDSVSTDPEINSITAEDSGKVYINFDRPMDEKTATNNSYYEINGETIPDAKIELKKDDTQVKISGLSNLNKNSNKLYIKTNVKDAYGNNVASDTYESFDLDEDTTKPAVTSVSALNDDTIRVRFNKDVDASFGKNVSNYKLQDESGTDITSKIASITIPGGDTAKTGSVFDISLEAGEKLSDSTYTITIKNIRDTASTPNVMDDYKTTFDGSEDVNAQVTGVYGVNGNPRKITLTFNKEMDSSTLGKTANYKYYNASADTKVLPSSADITVSNDNKSVTIELPDSYTYVDKDGNVANSSITSKDNQVKKIYAVGVKDKDGNDIEIGENGGEITTASSAGATTVKANSIRLYYDNDDLKASIGFTNPIDSDSIDNSKLDFYLAGVKADSASVSGSKVTLIFDSNDDGSNADTNINKIKAEGLNAKLTLGSPTGTVSTSVKDVMGAYVGIDSAVDMTPYYYDAAPRTIVIKDSNKTTNWKANVSGTTATVTTVFDTPLDDNSVKTSDFNFAVNGASLTPDSAKVAGNTIVFTFNTNKKTGNNTYGDYFKKGSTITVTPNSDAKTIATKMDRNDGNAYYDASDDDKQGIKIVITADVDKTELNTTIGEAEDLIADEYTAESYKKVTDAVTAAKAVLSDSNATQDQVNAAAKAIDDAIKALVLADGVIPEATVTTEYSSDLFGTKVVIKLAGVTDAAGASKYVVKYDGTTLSFNASQAGFATFVDGSVDDATAKSKVTVTLAE